MAESVKSTPARGKIAARVLAALERHDVGTLQSEAKALLAEGIPRETVVKACEACVLRVRAQGREKDEEMLLDVLDQLVGWCAPSVKLDA